jgi:type IV secretory pathway TraG/TraD family ATPase VirD4
MFKIYTSEKSLFLVALFISPQGRPMNAPPFDDVQSPLLMFPTKDRKVQDIFSTEDAFQHILAIGSSGSGKTSSFRTLAKAMLKKAFGFLVLCAKPEEALLWQRYAAECGRSDDLVIFSPDHEHRFNFLDYEYRKGGRHTENVVRLFATALELAERGQGKSHSDPYWQNAMMQLLRNAVDLLGIATGSINLDDLRKLIISAPQSPEDVTNPAWQEKSFLYQLGMKGDEGYDQLNAIQKHDFDMAVDYFLNEFPALDPKTRSGIVSGFTTLADGLLRGVMRDLFCTTTTITPEWSHEGAIIVLDLSVKSYGMVGVIAQGIFKYLWQQAAERRDVKKNPRGIVLWADECHYWINSYDMLFLTTARSSRVSTVYLTQNISTLYASIGGNDPINAVNSLLGNFGTKFFFSGNDATSNRWAAEQIGQSFQMMTTTGANFANPLQGGAGGSSTSVSMQLHYEVQPSTFLTLKNGGERNALTVDAILLKAGRTFHDTQKPYRLVQFNQAL